MKALRGVGAALLIVLACKLQAREPDVSGYKSYSTSGYTLIATERVFADRVALETSRMDWLLSKLVKRDPQLPKAPTFIVAVPRPMFIRYFQPGNGIVAEFVPGRFSNYLLVESILDHSWLAEEIYHEYTHLFVHTRFLGVKPLWFDEGMAQLFESSIFKNTYVEFGHPQYPPDKWMPLSQLLRLDKSSPEYRDRATTDAVHKESWSMIHRAVLGEPTFGKHLFGLIASLNQMKPIDEAVYQNFGMTVPQLDADMHDYMQKIFFNEFRLPLEVLPKPETQEGSALTELATLERFADAMLVSGFQPENLHEIVEAANRRAPDSAEVRVLRMRLAARDRDDITLELLSHDIAADSASPELARGAGLALFERVREEETQATMTPATLAAMRSHALDLLDRAIIANPNDAEAAWAFGMLAATLHRSLATADRRVNEARGTLPYNADLAMAAALLSDAQGKSSDEVKHLSAVLRFSRSPAQRQWAIDELSRLTTAAATSKVSP
jgi:hypothetical protein